MKKLLAIGALSMFTVASLLAQTSSISGTVADPTGAVIPKATVSVVNTQTGAKRSDVSDGQGRYTISQMTPGIYSLAAQASGFNDVKVERIELLVNTPATINVTFERVGSTSTSVMVEAAAGSSGWMFFCIASA